MDRIWGDKNRRKKIILFTDPNTVNIEHDTKERNRDKELKQ